MGKSCSTSDLSNQTKIGIGQGQKYKVSVDCRVDSQTNLGGPRLIQRVRMHLNFTK